MTLQMTKLHFTNGTQFYFHFFINLLNTLQNNLALVLADSPHSQMPFLELIFLSTLHQILNIFRSVLLKCFTLLLINCIRNKSHLERQFKLLFIFTRGNMMSVPDM